MQEATQIDNKLVRNESTLPAGPVAADLAKKEGKPKPVYDAEARNRFEFTARQGVLKYETAHVFEPLSDERYVTWLKDFNVRGNEDNVSEEAREASVKLWDDQIFQVEKIQYPEGADFRTLIPAQEKIEAINSFLAVAIGEDLQMVKGDRVLGSSAQTQTILTETFFNGDIVTQSHEMRLSNLELEKKYSRIQAKRFKQEPTRGLRRKPKIEFIPQDEKLGELYDEMFVSQEGFANGVIPLRFKTTVLHHLFGETLDQKKSSE
jgi:hypothetical protein